MNRVYMNSGLHSQYVVQSTVAQCSDSLCYTDRCDPNILRYEMAIRDTYQAQPSTRPWND
jgi:hypothetical protein